MFLYSLWVAPLPGTRYWVFTTYYVILIIGLKFLWQFPVFCLALNEAETYFYPSLQPYCPTEPYTMHAPANTTVQPLALFFMLKTSDATAALIQGHDMFHH